MEDQVMQCEVCDVEFTAFEDLECERCGRVVCETCLDRHEDCVP